MDGQMVNRINVIVFRQRPNSNDVVVLRLDT